MFSQLIFRTIFADEWFLCRTVNNAFLNSVSKCEYESIWELPRVIWMQHQNYSSKCTLALNFMDFKSMQFIAIVIIVNDNRIQAITACNFIYFGLNYAFFCCFLLCFAGTDIFFLHSCTTMTVWVNDFITSPNGSANAKTHIYICSKSRWKCLFMKLSCAWIMNN